MTISEEQLYNFHRDGFVKLNSYLSRLQLEDLQKKAEWVFQNACPLHLDGFGSMKWLFDNETEKFKHCGKTVQHLIELWRLCVSDIVVDLVRQFGVGIPSVCTRPVLFFNHPELAGDPVYNSVPSHQDWGSMQGSLNSVVVWVPLMDVGIKEGAIKVAPGSHKNGLRKRIGKEAFYYVDEEPMMSVPCNKGDIVVFNAFLIHKSGENVSKSPRWSCHFRYNDLTEYTYRQRGFVNPYDYAPQRELIIKDFP